MNGHAGKSRAAANTGAFKSGGANTSREHKIFIEEHEQRIERVDEALEEMDRELGGDEASSRDEETSAA